MDSKESDPLQGRVVLILPDGLFGAGEKVSLPEGMSTPAVIVRLQVAEILDKGQRPLGKTTHVLQNELPPFLLLPFPIAIVVPLYLEEEGKEGISG